MAKRLRHWLQKRRNKSKLFYAEDYSSYGAGGGVSFDADALDYFTRVEAAGGVIDSDVKTAFNTFVLAHKALTNASTGLTEWATLKEIWLPIHNANASINPALVKVKYPAGKSATLTNTSVVAGDYTLANGVYPASNPGGAKKLTTDMIPTDLDSANGSYIFSGLGTYSDPTDNCALMASGTGAVLSHRRRSTHQYDLYFGNLTSLLNISNAGFQIVNATASSDLRTYERGYEKTTNFVGRAAFSGTTAISLFSTGAGNYSNVSSWGYAFGTKFTTANVLAINAAWKNLFTALGRTYRNILFEGDSLTAGTGTTSGLKYSNVTIVNLVAAGNTRLSQTNNGTAGQTAVTMNTNKATDLPQFLDTDSVFVLYAGVNDINNGDTSANAWAAISSIITYVQGLGVTRIVVGTITPISGLAGGSETNRLALNTLIRDNAAGMSYSVMDFANDAAFVGGYNVTYYADNIHWNNTGAAVCAGLASTAIDALI